MRAWLRFFLRKNTSTIVFKILFASKIVSVLLCCYVLYYANSKPRIGFTNWCPLPIISVADVFLEQEKQLNHIWFR